MSPQSGLHVYDPYSYNPRKTQRKQRWSKEKFSAKEINHEKNWRDMTSRSIFFKPGIFGMRSWNYKNTEVSSILHEDLEEQCIEASIHSGTQHTT